MVGSDVFASGCMGRCEKGCNTKGYSMTKRANKKIGSLATSHNLEVQLIRTSNSCSDPRSQCLRLDAVAFVKCIVPYPRLRCLHWD